MQMNQKILTGLIFGLALIITLSIWAINVSRWPDWTGINQKTAWDLMDLIIVPVVLAVGGFLYGWMQRKADDKREFERQRRAVLLAYKKELLTLEYQLKSKQEKAERERNGKAFLDAEEEYRREVERTEKQREAELAYLEEIKRLTE